MNAETIVAVAKALAALGPEVLAAVEALIADLRAGKDPTPAERHLQVLAAIKLLEIEEP